MLAQWQLLPLIKEGNKKLIANTAQENTVQKVYLFQLEAAHPPVLHLTVISAGTTNGTGPNPSGNIQSFASKEPTHESDCERVTVCCHKCFRKDVQICSCNRPVVK